MPSLALTLPLAYPKLGTNAAGVSYTVVNRAALSQNGYGETERERERARERERERERGRER
jgi:hypothetical protein